MATVPARTIRMLPPAGSASPVSIFGRTYTPVAGAFIDAPVGDSGILSCNGWLAVCMSGPTSARPLATDGDHALVTGKPFLDTSLGKVIHYNGTAWIDSTTGGAV